MKFIATSATLLASAATLLATPLAAAETDGTTQPDRDYLPRDIVVTGQRDGYGEDDGSTATKTPTPLIDVPQTVTMITKDQLEDQAITYLNDALRYVPGVTIGTGEGHRDHVLIRGQVTTADFYVDGIRDDAEYYRALYNIERVEVLKGANALIFGRGGGGGIINRVTKTANFDEQKIGLAGSVDTFGAFNLSADLNQPFSDAVAGRLNATYEEFDSHRDFYEGRFFGIAPTITAKLGEATRLTAQYSYEDDDRVTDRGIPSLNDGNSATVDGPLRGYDKTFFGSRTFNRADSQTHIARLRLDHSFSETLSLNVTGQYANYDKYYGNVIPSGSNGTTVSLSGYTSDTARENWIGQANLVWDTDFGGIGNTLLTGIEYGDQSSDAQRHNAVFTGSTTVPLARVINVPGVTEGALSRSSTSSLNTFSAYIQDQLDFGIVQVVAGVRYDEFDLDTTNLVNNFNGRRKDSKWSPRAGLILKPNETLSLYTSYSTSFLPQSGDQFTVLDATTDDLRPEKFENIEAGIKWAIKPDLFATAAVFQLDRSNTRAVDPNDTTLTVLTGKSRVKGVEMGLVGKVMPNWQTSFGYTYLDGEIRSTTTAAPAGRRLHQLPKHQISLWNRYDLTANFGLGAGVIHQSKQFASVSNAVALPSYWRVDAAAYYTVNDRLSIQLNVENLFDEGYYASAHGDNNMQPAKPISARIGVKLAM